MNAEDRVVLVDERDNEVGVMGKLAAHQTGSRHRAFSIFIFNPQGELLLQKRAGGKYHSGGLWTNTCCSHPRPGEAILDAAHRRLKEEMGFDCALEETHRFIYHVTLDNNLIEHEFDHVLVGTSNRSPSPNPEEAEDWKWASPGALENDMKAHPDNYSYWLRTCFGDVMSRIRGSRNG